MTKFTPRFQLEVTQEHIDRAEARESNACAIADALKDRWPAARFISVDLQCIRFTIDGQRYEYLTPVRAQRLIVRFDQGDHTEAFRTALQSPRLTQQQSPRSPRAQYARNASDKAKRVLVRERKEAGLEPPTADELKVVAATARAEALADGTYPPGPLTRKTPAARPSPLAAPTSRQSQRRFGVKGLRP